MTSVTPSTLSAKETSNYARLCRLFVEVGSEVLRDIFDRLCLPEDLPTVLAHPQNQAKLQTLRKKRVLSISQWRRLYPAVKSSVSLRDCDSSLLLLLLKNIAGLTLPVSGWSNIPLGSDTSAEAEITRIKILRDRVYSHVTQGSVDDSEFSIYWSNIKETFLRVGGPLYEDAINDLKNCCMDADFEEHYQELFREWLKDDDYITDKSYEGETVKKATKEEVMKGSIGISGQKIGMEEMAQMPVEKRSAENFKANPPELSVKLPISSDLPNCSCPWNNIALPVDILLLTEEDCEFLSCFAYLKEPVKSYYKSIGYVYFGCMGEGEGEQIKTALMKCPKGLAGPRGSLSVFKDAILLLRPKAVFSVGACSVVNSRKVKLGDVVVSSKLITSAHKTPSSREINTLIKHVADGWKAPLQNADEYHTKVHCHEMVLSISEVNKDIIGQHPEAIAVEMEGAGFHLLDFKTKWAYVKGIKDFVGDRHSSSEKWTEIACVMAASVVANILSDPAKFQDWPHFNADDVNQMKSKVGDISDKLETVMARQDKITSDLSEMKSLVGNLGVTLMEQQGETKSEDWFDPAEMIAYIRQLYKTREGTLNLFPWCEHLNFSLGDLFTRLKVTYKEKTRGTAADRVVAISEIFNMHEECEEPRVVLIEGKPGMGKTIFCQKVALDWATQKPATGNYFAKFLIALLIKCREVQSDLWEAIDDQLLPRDIDDDQRKRFFDFICHNQSKVLLVLDGLSEVSERKLPMFSEIIQGQVLPICRVVVTTRHEAGIKVRKYSDTLLEVEGFTKEDAVTFIKNYFRANPNLAAQLIERLSHEKSWYEMSTNPLYITLLCMVFEDFGGVFPERRSTLYKDIVECILRSYRTKQQLPEIEEGLVELYESELKHLGSIALKGLLEGNLDFDEKELRKHKLSELPGFGFLSVQPGGSKVKPTRRYGFLHETFQEFFAAYYLSCQLIKKEITTHSIAADRRYRNELKEVLLFTFGILAARCQETAENLVKSMATQVNQEEGEKEVSHSMRILLECIYECENDNNFHAELARALGTCLQIEAIDISTIGLHRAEAILLSNVLETNKSVRILHLVDGIIDEAAAAALAKCLKENTFPTELDLFFNHICDAGAAALAECLKTNTSLTKLNLGENFIGEDGAAALVECLKENTSLTELNLGGNNIGDAGAVTLAKCLKYNTSLTEVNLGGNNIGDGGAVTLAKCLKYNISLTEVNLGGNNIGDAGAVALAECLKENTSLTELNLSDNNIRDVGATVLAYCLNYNSSLTELNLGGNNISDGGAVALAEGLTYNTSLTELNLDGCNIGDAGAAALAEGLRCNTSLTELNLDGSNIGDAGAAALAEGLRCNTSLTELNLDGSNIGDAGAAALAEGLRCNTSLTELNLDGSNIGDAGAAALAEGLRCNTSLTKLNLDGSNIGDAGAAALAEGLRCNTSLTKLNLDGSNIGDAGAAALAEGLRCNTSLTKLNLDGSNIGDAVALLRV
ncbi:protein NLRC3-like isoform X2 [Stylophora pistillata]|nr:protein NLRC3-like isoform X2 [Stylophora pistillata]